MSTEQQISEEKEKTGLHSTALRYGKVEYRNKKLISDHKNRCRKTKKGLESAYTQNRYRQEMLISWARLISG